MYVKILTPQAHGKVAYDKSGTARRATNYLEKEAKENGRTAVFFSGAERGTLSGDEVVTLLDNNHKGLGKDAAKFYSLVLSPSAEEVAALGNNTEALQRYTREAMELYAQNFKLKGGRSLHESDLVWAATIHQERKHRGTDAGTSGDYKPGLQTHVHIMVSARDAEQKSTLNPLGQAARFNRVEFQAQVGTQLDEQLGYTSQKADTASSSRATRVREKATDIKERASANRDKKPLTAEQIIAKDRRLDGQVARVNTKLNERNQLDPLEVKEAAKARNYDKTFYTILGRIERNAEQGKPTGNPYEYLRTGQVQAESSLHTIPGYKPQLGEGRASKSIPTGVGLHSFEHSLNNLSRAMATKGRTQDVRSEEEKRRDYEQEM